MIGDASRTLLCTLALCLAALPRVHALQADDVDCAGCVGTPDLAGKAVTGKKLKNNAVTNKKVKKNALQGSRVKDKTVQKNDLSAALIRELGAGFLRVVDKDGKFVGPLHPGGSGVVLHTGPGAAEYGFLPVGQNGIYSIGTIYYSEPGCKGTPYTDYVPTVVIANVGTFLLNNAFKSLDVGLDPATGELAAMVAKDPTANTTNETVQSKAARITDDAGHIAYQCSDGSASVDVVEARAARHIADIDNPPFRILNGQ